MKKNTLIVVCAMLLVLGLATSAFAAIPSQTFILPELGESYSTGYFINAGYTDCMKKVLDAINFRVDNKPAPKDVYFVISQGYTMNITKPTQIVTPANDFPQLSYYNQVGKEPVLYAAGNGDLIVGPTVSAPKLMSGANEVLGTIAGNTITFTVEDATAYDNAGITLSEQVHVRVSRADATVLRDWTLVDPGELTGDTAMQNLFSVTGTQNGIDLKAKSPLTVDLRSTANQTITTYTVVIN